MEHFIVEYIGREDDSIKSCEAKSLCDLCRSLARIYKWGNRVVHISHVSDDTSWGGSYGTHLGKKVHFDYRDDGGIVPTGLGSSRVSKQQKNTSQPGL